MKKLLAILLAATMAASLAACGGTTEEKKPTVAQDTAVIGMKFTPPEGYKTVERYLEEDANGAVTQKSLAYEFEDGSKKTYAYATGHKLEDVLDLSKMEKTEQAGQTFYLRNEDNGHQAYAQVGEFIYGVEYAPAEDKDDDTMIGKMLSDVSFTDNTETLHDKDAIDFGKMKYTIDDKLSICGYNTSLEETPKGDLVRQAITWVFGKSADDHDFRFQISQKKNTTLKEEQSEGKEYEEKTVNGITYSVRKASGDDKPYEYLTQQGDDVYTIRNRGKGGGWFIDRSDESEAAFEAFLNTISFGE